MKKKNLAKGIGIILFALLPTMLAFSQVGINNTGANPDPSAMLDISSTVRGILFPRMTTAQRDAISSPAESLLIFNTTSKCYEFFCYGVWQKLGCGTCPPPAQPSAIVGNTLITNSTYPNYYTVTPVPGVIYSWSYTGYGFYYEFSIQNSTYQIEAYFVPTATPGELICTPHSSSCDGIGPPSQIHININFPCIVGTSISGGTVFYSGNGKCYISSKADQGYAKWYNGNFITTSATGTAIGDGKINTPMIITSQGNGNYAAKMCDTLTLWGYTDWYLPSKDELEQMYIQKNSIGGFINNPGNYWSSTEINAFTANSRDFVSGITNNLSKDAIFGVRCIRSYSP